MNLTPAQMATKMSRAAASVDAAGMAGARAAGTVLASSVRRELVGAVGSDMRMSGVGQRGAAVGVRLRSYGRGSTPTATVETRGPVHLVERNTKRHPITPRLGGRRRALRLADDKFRSTVIHPGTKGKRPVATGVSRGEPAAIAALRATVLRRDGATALSQIL